MELAFLDLWWVEVLIGVAVALFTFIVIPNKHWATILSFFGATLTPVLNKVDSLSDGAAAIARGAGLDGLANILEKLGDSADEIEDPLRLLQEYTEDGELDAAELKTIIDEVGEGAMSVKALVVAIVGLVKKEEETE